MLRWVHHPQLGVPVPGTVIFLVKLRLLAASKPPVWRRLLVPADIRLDRLHRVIQVAIGREYYHLHVFSSGSVEYGLPDPELGHRDERRASVGAPT